MKEDELLAKLKLEIDFAARALDQAVRLYDECQFELEKAYSDYNRTIRLLARLRKSKSITKVELESINKSVNELKKELAKIKKSYASIRAYKIVAEQKHQRLLSAHLNRVNYLKKIAKNKHDYLGLPGLEDIGEFEIDRKGDGTIHVYFGGSADPLGDGHGHYVYSPLGKLVYKRDPFTPRGRQNHLGPYNDGSEGGFDRPVHGFIADEPYSLAYGWGTKKGHTLLAKGHLKADAFRESQDLIIYRPGEGPINDESFRPSHKRA